MERFLIIVDGFQPLTIITKHSILDVAADLDPHLYTTIIKCIRQLFSSFNFELLEMVWQNSKIFLFVETPFLV